MSKSRNPAAYLDTISRCCLFEGLAKAEMEELLMRDGVSVAHFSRGETIYAPDGFLRSLGVVLSGGASVRKLAGESSMLMSVLEADDIFGAATLFCEDAEYVATIVAESSTWVLLITEDAFLAMMRGRFTIAENYMRYLTRRIRFLSGRIDGFVRPGCEERVLQYLKKTAPDATPSMTAMAETLGISRASLYRVLDALAERGRIQRNGRHIVLTEGE